MKFSTRVRIAIWYKKWLNEKNKERDDYPIADAPETFLAFLESHGLLREPHPLCCKMLTPETCVMSGNTALPMMHRIRARAVVITTM